MELFKQNHIKYGLIMSSLIIVCLLLMEITGQNETFNQKNPLVAFFFVIMPFVVWWIGINAKKKERGNKITYNEAFFEGFKISAVFAITSSIIFLFYYLFINPEIVASLKEAYRLGEDASNMKAITYDLVIQIFSSILFGSIYAGIIANFIKTKARTQQ